jgi:leucyl/phenylalanyl-tRNA--protein transferase
LPVFELTDDLIFPPPELAERDGLLCVGGDLSEERLLLAYSMGIFPWYSDGDPILWWSPDPRLVLFPRELKVSRSLRQALKNNIYEITIDTAFPEVIRNCASASRKGDEGTWITAEMADAYIQLHRSGFAHSVESRHNGELAGGLYGVALGGVFFGESMFAKKNNASKVAFVALVQQLIKRDFALIDCQVTTGHLMSLGAREIPRSEFIQRVEKALKMPVKKGNWNLESRE